MAPTYEESKVLTAEQLDAAKNSAKAILDQRMLANLGRAGDQTTARHGPAGEKRPRGLEVGLLFTTLKPTSRDVFLICGDEHPRFPPSNDYGFAELADLGIEQTDDSLALCVDGDPALWIFPLIRGQMVEHHAGSVPGPATSRGRSAMQEALVQVCRPI